MSAHKYACGQKVTFTDRRVARPGPAPHFVITKFLPIGDEAPRYEVQGTNEKFSRVANEALLQVVPSGELVEINGGTNADSR